MIESFKLPTITPETLTGSICSFNDEYGGLPLKSCTSLITGYQEGSGTPSPSNVRPLHAFSSADLTANGQTYTFTFGKDIYQGSIDWWTGVVRATWLLDTFYGSPSEAWEIRSDGTTSRRFNLLLAHSVPSEYVANYLHWSDTAVGEWGTYNIRGADNNNLAVKDNQSQFATVEAFKTYLSSNPLQLAYELANPIEIPLGGINILTQEGQNNIFCDTGDTNLEWLKVN